MPKDNEPSAELYVRRLGADKDCRQRMSVFLQVGPWGQQLGVLVHGKDGLWYSSRGNASARIAGSESPELPLNTIVGANGSLIARKLLEEGK